MDIRIFQLLNKACHPNTKDTEALIFMRKVRNLLDRDNKDFSSFITPSAPTEKPVFRSFGSVNDENQRLREQIEALQNQVKGLQRKEHQFDSSKAKKKNDDGTMPYLTFEQEMTRIWGKVHGAKTAFAAHYGKMIGNPAFRENNINAWMVTGKYKGIVPTDAVNALKTFKREDTSKEKSTLEFDMKVWRMIQNGNMKESAIVIELGEGPGKVKKARQRMRLRSAIRQLYDAGRTVVPSIMEAISSDFLSSVTGSATQIGKIVAEIEAGKLPAETFDKGKEGARAFNLDVFDPDQQVIA